MIRCAAFGDLDAATLYALLRLRVDVFVVEQSCPYPELDGRDVDPATRHCWIAEGDRVLACLRTLREADGTLRIGRVATAASARGRGLASQLLAHVLADERGAVVLSAQTPTVGLYERFGFAVTGPEYDDEGIPHVDMRRPPVAPAADPPHA